MTATPGAPPAPALLNAPGSRSPENCGRQEEKRGIIRWPRPDYHSGRAKARGEKEEQIEADLELPKAAAPGLPKDDAALVATLRQTLRVIGKPAEAKDIAQRFRDGGQASRRVDRGLRLLAAAGVVRRVPSRLVRAF